MINKRGQVAIFVIIALAIVGISLILLLYPRFSPSSSGATFSPEEKLRSCIEPTLKKSIESLAKTGGYAEPEGYLNYRGEKVKYLCYTGNYYKTCVVQQPMIKENFEKELLKVIKPEGEKCFEALKAEYKKRGYEVVASDVSLSFSFEPKKMEMKFEAPMTISKDSVQTFDSFTVSADSQMYNLLMVSTSIIDYESKWGDSETTDYIYYYPDLKITKDRTEDSSKVYTLRNVVTNESFRFASRSLAWPPGGEK